MLKRISRCILLILACVSVLCIMHYIKSYKNVKKSSPLWIYTTPSFTTFCASASLHGNRKMVLANANVYIDYCRSIIFQRELVSDSLWMSVGGDRHAFVYSAYHVNNNGSKIVIIGAKTRPESKAICQFWYNSENSDDIYLNEVLATTQLFHDSKGLRYSGVLFECKIYSDNVPKYVSIVTANCDVPTNLIIVQKATNPPKYTWNFTVCLSPIHLQFSKSFDLVEWIELNTILGADKFIVYNHSIANNVARVLDYYSRRGVVEVLPWNLPLSVNFPREYYKNEIHYFGQVVALNDCFYRNKFLSEFIVNIDIDEFIVPHSAKLQTWYDLIDKKPLRKAVYTFRHTYFKKQRNVTIDNTVTRNLDLINKYKFVTLQQLQREKKIFVPKSRSKYFARTSDVFQLMIHEVPGVVSENVPADIALLHHYRQWGGKYDPEDMNVYDDTVPAKYGDKLFSSVVKTWTKISTESMMMQ